MNNIEKEVEEFFKTHKPVDAYELMAELKKKYNLTDTEAYTPISKYLSASWGVNNKPIKSRQWL